MKNGCHLLMYVYPSISLLIFSCRNLLCFPITINNRGTVNVTLEEGRKVEMGDDESGNKGL